MNCRSRVEPEQPEGWNQNPSALNADATTRADLNHIANSRQQTDHGIDPINTLVYEKPPIQPVTSAKSADVKARAPHKQERNDGEDMPNRDGSAGVGSTMAACRKGTNDLVRRVKAILHKYAKFVGPGFMVAVAYIDPGNYATDVAAGASFKFRLLFIVLMSNLFAIFLQSLCIKLGSVTGLNLAENCKANLPPWMNYTLYVFAEGAIIATDIAEVIGTAIALNLLFHIPLVAGCAISIVDVLIILSVYRPSGSMSTLRAFECFVMCLVLGVFICFCFELTKIKASVGEVFQGFLPSSTLAKPQALYQSCGILGATVMPHSLYLGSGIVQPRLREFDGKQNITTTTETDSLQDEIKYKPSLAAIKACMSYSIVELSISLFTFALFINSAILIVAGASLYGIPDASDADLFSIHSLLAKSVAPVAGTLFALALLLSGTSAGIVCTMAGQMVSEGQLNWTVKPWVRRLITRSISITPSIIIAGALGREGLGAALRGSQIALSVILPFVSAPLIWFTCRAQYMKVEIGHDNGTLEAENQTSEHVQMRNGWFTTGLALVIWVITVGMNVALLVLVGLGLA